MGRQREQVRLEIRSGRGEQGGRRGLLQLSLHVDPSLVDWFRDLRPAADMDPHAEPLHLYAGDELLSSLAPAGETPVGPPAQVDERRLESLRVEAQRLEIKGERLSGQAQVNERRVAALEAELVALESRVEAARTRCTDEIARCDGLVKAAHELAMTQRAQIVADMQCFRVENEAARKSMMSSLSDVQEILASLIAGEGESARTIEARRLQAQLQLTDAVADLRRLELQATAGALQTAGRPSVTENLERMGVTLDKVVAGAVDLINTLKGKAATQ